MILMRERSGRSGRLRGSQKPGTAMGSAFTAGVLGTEGPTDGEVGDSCLGVCSCARDTASVPTMIATENIAVPKPRQHALIDGIIRTTLPEPAATIVIAAAAG